MVSPRSVAWLAKTGVIINDRHAAKGWPNHWAQAICVE